MTQRVPHILLPVLVSVLAFGCEMSDYVVASRDTSAVIGGATGEKVGVEGSNQLGGQGGQLAQVGDIDLGDINLEAGLVFHFPFDGTLDDVAGGRVGKQVSEDGSEVGFVPGVSGQSLDLSQTTTHVILDNESAFAPDSLTLAFWAQSSLPAAVSAPQTLLGLGRDCLNSYHCGIYPDETIKCELNDGRGWCEDSVSLDVLWPEGRFVHVAFVIEQDANEPVARLRLYLDGELVSSEERADYYSVDEPERPFAIGANYQQVDEVGLAPYYSKAQLDDARLYNRALSELEVQRLFEERGAQ